MQLTHDEQQRADALTGVLQWIADAKARRLQRSRAVEASAHPTPISPSDPNAVDTLPDPPHAVQRVA